MLRNKWVILSFLLPSIVVFSFTVVLPIVWSMYYSLFNWNGVSAMRFMGLGNFAKLFTDNYFITALVNNAWYLLINLAGQVGLGLLLAILLTNVEWGCEIYKTVYFAPAILSAVALGQFFQKFYGIDPIGMLNMLLKGFGLDGMMRPWLGDSQTALASVALCEVYKNLGLYMVILFSGLIAIPQSVLESAMLDGAHGFRLFWSIKLPYISGVLTVAMVMAVNGLLKAFEIPFITTYGGPGSASELVTTYMYKTAFNSAKYGYGSAIAVFLVIESVVVVGLLRAAMNRKERELA